MSNLKLATWDATRRAYDVVRDLTESEKALHDEYTPIVLEARDRLRLFRILAKNYKEWSDFLAGLLSVKRVEHDDTEDELNRLMLNYLTFAYTIREHFEVSFRQRFKKDANRMKEYSDFIDQLCGTSWAFAFICDYRGYVQHVGLAISRFSRKVSRTSVILSIEADPVYLLEQTRDWKRSALKADHGSIDLTDVLQEFHAHMLQSYAPYVAKTFFPELESASKFYGNLTQEAKNKSENSSMIFSLGDPVTSIKGSKIATNIQMMFVPNDVYKELGIVKH